MKSRFKAAFERVRPILSVCLASLYPLRDEQIYQAVCAGCIDSSLSQEEFSVRLQSIGSLLTRRVDGRRVFLHPSFREWLCMAPIKSSNLNVQSNRFNIDTRNGHALLALLLSRQAKTLHFSATIELGHHILKSHIFRGSRSQTGFSSSMQNAIWLMSSKVDIAGGLLAPRNLFYPNLRVSKLLLSAGAPLNRVTTAVQGATPLIVAAKNGCLPFVRLLLEHGATVDAKNEIGRSAMSYAAENGHVQILEVLYESNASIDTIDHNGISPCIYAAKNARTEVNLKI